MKARRSGNGFTLIELILGFAIVGIVAGFGLYSLSGGYSSTQSRGMAEEITEELKAARAQAIAEQGPVAVVFPGRRSQAFYQVSGIAKPTVRRGINYSETYPQSCFYWGTWENAQPQILASIDDEPTNEVLNLRDWAEQLPSPADYAIVFTPKGTVRGVNVSLFPGGEYRLVVSNGIHADQGAPTAASKPYTVRISQTGSVVLERGVRGAQVSEVPAIPLASISNTVPPPSPPAGGLRMQSPLSAEPIPEEVPEGGVVTVVPKEGYITIVARAEDATGGPLSITWEGRGPKGPGQFSSEGTVPMVWDARKLDSTPEEMDNPWTGVPTGTPITPCWVSRVNWAPPDKAENQERYTISCTIRNSLGEEIQATLGTSASVKIVPSHRVASICWDTNFGGEDGWDNFYVSWLNPEGTNVINVTTPDQVWEQLTPVWDPTGQKIAFYSGSFIGPNEEKFEANLYIVNSDGTNMRKLFSCSGYYMDYKFGPSFSPDGAKVAFSAYQDEDNDINSVVRVCRIAGNPTVRDVTYAPTIPNGYIDHTDVSWHPTDDKYVLYTMNEINHDPAVETNSGVYVARIDDNDPQAGNQPVTEFTRINDPYGEKVAGEAHWSYGGGKIVYCAGGKVYWRKFISGTVTGTATEVTPPGGGYFTTPRYSTDDSKIAVVDDEGRLFVILVNGSSVGPIARDVDGYNWAPDGERLVVTDWDGQMWVVHHTGSTRRNITPPGFNAFSTPSWWRAAP